MPKLDFEVILSAIVTMIQAKLNSKLTAISNEKNDGLTLDPVDTNAYAILDLNKEIYNYDPFVALLVNDFKSDHLPGGTAHTVSMWALILKTDQNEASIVPKMLRYMRAMSEIFEDNFDVNGISSKLEIESLAPRMLEDLNTSNLFRGTGVSVTFSFTS